MEKLRWGVIGAGGIADRRTIPGMMLANNAELVSVMEIHSESAEQLEPNGTQSVHMFRRKPYLLILRSMQSTSHHRW